METGSNTKRQIMLVDDHPIVRHGLSTLINAEEDMVVSSECSSASETFERLSIACPDIVLADVSLQGSSGIDLTKSIKDQFPHLPVLILSMHDEEVYAERALRAGARGYVMKQESADTVLKAVRTVLKGDIYLSERLSSKLLKEIMDGTGTEPDQFGVGRLSDRELEVFELIGRGYATRRIADSLHLSIKTIETHRAHIKQKLKLGNATELVHHAFLWIESGATK